MSQSTAVYHNVVATHHTCLCPPLLPDHPAQTVLFSDAVACVTTRVPGPRVGLKSLSQSAHAIPDPTPVVNATGHARRRKRMTDAATPTLKPTPVLTSISARQRSYFWLTIFSLYDGFDDMACCTRQLEGRKPEIVSDSDCTDVIYFGSL